MKVLLIGGTGVLSAEILTESQRLGYEVTVLNRGHHNDELRKDINIIKCDIRDTIALRKCMDNRHYDVVVDFLSYNTSHLSDTLSVLSNRCTQYIFISSCCVFRRDSGDFPIQETSPKPNRLLKYGVDKYECEKFLRASIDLKCKYTIVRPYITYGDTRIPFGIAPDPRKHWTIIGRLLADKPFFVWEEKGHIPICTLMHSKDFAKIFCQLFLNEKSYNEDVNIVGKDYLNWKDYIDVLERILKKDHLEVLTLPAEEVRKYLYWHRDYLTGDRNLDAIFDRTKLKNLVRDCTQEVSIEEGTIRTIERYRERNYFSGIDYAYDGAVDRMLVKNGVKDIKFIDYLGNATFRDKLTYNLHRYLSVDALRKITTIRNIIKTWAYDKD